MLVILAGAVLLKVIYLLQCRHGLAYFDIPLIDAEYYDRWARRVAAGQGYGPSPFYLAPLYPYALAVLRGVFGDQLLPVYIAQSALGVVNLLLVYVLGRKLFGRAAGLLAMLLVLLYAPILILESKLLSETLGVTLTLLALALLLRAIDKPDGRTALAAGLVLGLSILCRSSNLLFAMPVLVWFAWRALRDGGRHAWRTEALLAGGVALTILPVTVRNYVVGNDLVLIQTNGGMTFAQGNNENSVGVISHPPGVSAGILNQQAEEMRVASHELGRPVKPSESSTFWFKRSLAWIREHPQDYIRLLARKVVYALNNREELDSYETYYEVAAVPILRLAFVPFSVVLGFAVLGFAYSTRSRGAQVLVLYVATVLLTLIIFYVSSRYRVMAVPVLAVLAGHGLVCTWGHLRQRRLTRLALSILLVAGLFAVAQVPYPMSRSTGSFVLKEVAGHHRARGQLDEAIEVLTHALEVSPQSTELHSELGLILARRGKFAEAVQAYRKALPDWSHVVRLHLNLADALERLGERDEADKHWNEALRLAPDSVEACVNRGAALFARGNTSEAIGFFERAVRFGPDSALAHNNLGSALAQVQRRQEALQHFREAVRLDPDYYRARGNLSRALAESDRVEEAIENLKEGLRRQPDFSPFHYDLARLLARAGRRNEAISAYRQLLRLDPNHRAARRELAVLLGSW